MKYHFQPWETLAGSTHDYDPLTTARDLAHIVSTAGGQPVELQLAELLVNETDSEYIDDIIEEMVDWLNENASLPPSCVIDWRDGEIMCLPFHDDEYPKIEDGSGIFYAVNDHGNVACYAWDDGMNGYRKVWDMV